MAQGQNLHLTRGQLYNLYWIEGLSTMQIAKKLNCKFSIICSTMKKFGLPVRTPSQRNSGLRNPAYKGKWKATTGYIVLHLLSDDPFFPMANKQGQCFEHRYVMAKKLNRILGREEKVHHINGDKTDNREENLEVVSSKVNNIYTELCSQCSIKAELEELREYRRRIEEQKIY